MMAQRLLYLVQNQCPRDRTRTKSHVIDVKKKGITRTSQKYNSDPKQKADDNKGQKLELVATTVGFVKVLSNIELFALRNQVYFA